MKRCNACRELFEDQFAYCPTDAALLVLLATRTDELHLTIIDSAGLLDRLVQESRFHVEELRRSWPELKRDPIGAGKTLLGTVVMKLRRSLLTANSIAATSTAILILFSALLLLVVVDKRSQRTMMARAEVERVQMLELPSVEIVPRDDKGFGTGSQGRVGMKVGHGEGSGPKPKKSNGGGSGGDNDTSPPQVGAIPPPSLIPAPIPKLPPVQKASLAYAGVDIDPALWKALPMAVYGDPNSKSSVPSNGPGRDGGMGTDEGTGVGGGKGPGYGPGTDGNTGGGLKGQGCCGDGGGRGNNPNPDDPDRVYGQGQVNERARVLAKPEPQYTEEARKGGITGAVILRVVFARTGEVTNIRAVTTLPFGLTERAIAAARQIRFRPAMVAGRPVNVFMQLEYNFNLY